MEASESKTKRILYVGGLDEAVTSAILQAAFIPFGEITEIQVPMDHVSQKNRGFGFVEFAEQSDANDALENMHNSELFGRVLKVSIARPQQTRGRAVWADAEEWYKGLADGEAPADKATAAGGGAGKAESGE